MEFNDFIFCNEKITILKNYNNKVYFDAKEIATILGYVDVKKTIQRNVPSDEKTYWKNIRDEFPVIEKQKHRDKIFITEAGLYSLIFGSSKQVAVEFRKWISKEVLPQIRETGMYIPTKEKCVEIMRDLSKLSFDTDPQKTLESIGKDHSIENIETVKFHLGSRLSREYVEYSFYEIAGIVSDLILNCDVREDAEELERLRDIKDKAEIIRTKTKTYFGEELDPEIIHSV